MNNRHRTVVAPPALAMGQARRTAVGHRARPAGGVSPAAVGRQIGPQVVLMALRIRLAAMSGRAMKAACDPSLTGSMLALIRLADGQGREPLRKLPHRHGAAVSAPVEVIEADEQGVSECCLLDQGLDVLE